MVSASSLFTDSDRERVNNSVRAAEARTSAEIVPVVATASGRYDRAEDLIGLWLGVLFMVVTAVFWRSPAVSMESGSWDSDPSLRQAGKVVGAMLVGYLAGVTLGSRLSLLRRLFTPVRQMHDEVRQTAQAVFYDKRVHHTQSAGGLLIYVSLFEHVVTILADQSVLKAIGQPVLDELCNAMTLSLRQDAPTVALCQIIDAAGEQLAIALPRQASDMNELPDALVTID